MPKLSNGSLRDHAARLVALSLGIVGLSLVFGYCGNLEMVSSVAAATQANRMVAELAHLRASTAEVVMSRNRYAITGDSAFRDHYLHAEVELRSYLKRLRATSGATPSQKAAIDRIAAAMEALLKRSAESMQGGPASKPSQEEQVALTRSNARDSLQVTDLVTQLEQEQERLLAVREARVRDVSQTAIRTIVPAGVTLMVLLSIALYGVRGRLLQRAQAEDRLGVANTELERSIARAEARNKDSQLLAELSRLLQASTDEDEALLVLARYAGELFPNTSGAIDLFRASRDILEPGATWGTVFVPKEAFHPEQCWALRLGRPYQFIAGGRNPACPHLLDKAQCALCVPLASQGETLGILYLMCVESVSAGKPDPFDLNLAGNIGDLGALAIANIRLREKLRNQSIRDPLTDLFNRRFLEENLLIELHRVQRDGGELSVAMLDLDHFKDFNDTQGHATGDWLLVTFGRFLQTTMRRGDVACRYGGEEFVVLLPGAGAAAARERMASVLRTWSELPLQFEGRRLGPVTFSAGIAARVAAQLDGDALIRSADEALYAAKQAGRNQVLIWPIRLPEMTPALG